MRSRIDGFRVSCIVSDPHSVSTDSTDTRRSRCFRRLERMQQARHTTAMMADGVAVAAGTITDRFFKLLLTAAGVTVGPKVPVYEVAFTMTVWETTAMDVIDDSPAEAAVAMLFGAEFVTAATRLTSADGKFKLGVGDVGEDEGPIKVKDDWRMSARGPFVPPEIDMRLSGVYSK
jgi:hypothetical protein